PAKLTAVATAIAATQGVEHRVVRLFGLVVGVEQQRRGIGAPGVPVGDAPGGDADAAGDSHAGFSDRPVYVGLGGSGTADVQFSDLHVNAEVREALEVGPIAAEVGVPAEVTLEAHTVDRYAAVAEVDDHVVNGRSEEHTSELQSRENLVCR